MVQISNDCMRTTIKTVCCSLPTDIQPKSSGLSPLSQLENFTGSHWLVTTLPAGLGSSTLGLSPGQAHYIVLLGKVHVLPVDSNIPHADSHNYKWLYNHVCTSEFFFSGNLFSSLEGLEVVWELKTVEGVGSVSAQLVLK